MKLCTKTLCDKPQESGSIAETPHYLYYELGDGLDQVLIDESLIQFRLIPWIRTPLSKSHIATTC